MGARRAGPVQINERLSGITPCPGLTLLNVRELSSCCYIKSFVLDGDTGADLLTESVFYKFGGMCSPGLRSY